MVRARMVRNAVRRRLRDAQRKFEAGWQVPLTPEERALWNNGKKVWVDDVVSCNTRPYLVGDVACLVLVCQDLLTDAYGQPVKLRVGKVWRSYQGHAPRSLSPTGVDGAYWLHAALMLGDASLADLRLKWDRAKTSGLARGRRPIQRFVRSAKEMQQADGRDPRNLRSTELMYV